MRGSELSFFEHSNVSRGLHFKAVLILMLLCTQGVASAQGFKDRLLLMQQEYSKLKSVHVVMNIQAFENSESTNSFYKETAIIKREGTNYLSQFSGMDMLMNEKYILMVNQNSKQIICSKRNLKGEDKFSDPVSINLDSILGFYGTPVLIGSENNVEHFRVDQKQGTIRVVDLYIDTSLNVLKRLDYYYKEGQYVKIQFEVFDTSPVFDPAQFSDTNYVVSEKGRLKPSVKYSSFNVVLN